MPKLSDLTYKELAVNQSAEAKFFVPTPTTYYADYFADILLTPIYSFQSIPVTTNTGTQIKYIQLLRSEVLSNIAIVNNTAALDDNNFAWTWGPNSNGQLGNNTTTNSSTPISVIGNNKFTQIVTDGEGCCIALDYNGYAWSWGVNGTYGNLADGTNTNRSSPVSVIGGNQFVMISEGSADTNFPGAFKALDINGVAWAWGYNTNGSIGDYTTAHRSSPTSVVSGVNFVAINGCLAIDVSNYCWAWGANGAGQLGDGTNNNRSSPVSVLGLSNNIVYISNNQASTHSLVVTSDGYCYAMGNNTYGQLGDGTTTGKLSPVSVIGGRRFTQVATTMNTIGSNYGSSYGLDDIGAIWAWGANNYGQLGDGTTTTRSSPVSVRQGTRKFIQINACNGAAVATDMDGNVWAWGLIPWDPTSTIQSSNPVMFQNFKAQVKNY